MCAVFTSNKTLVSRTVVCVSLASLTGFTSPTFSFLYLGPRHAPKHDPNPTLLFSPPLLRSYMTYKVKQLYCSSAKQNKRKLHYKRWWIMKYVSEDFLATQCTGILVSIQFVSSFPALYTTLCHGLPSHGERSCAWPGTHCLTSLCFISFMLRKSIFRVIEMYHTYIKYIPSSYT